MLIGLLVETSKIWAMCILAIIGGFFLGATITFFLYDRWAYKRFKANDEQWQKLVTEQRDIIRLYQDEYDKKIDGFRENIDIDVD